MLIVSGELQGEVSVPSHEARELLFAIYRNIICFIYSFQTAWVGVEGGITPSAPPEEAPLSVLGSGNELLLKF